MSVRPVKRTKCWAGRGPKAISSHLTFHGFNIPWEVESYAVDFQTAEDQGGYFDFSHWSVVEIKGSDSADYLQRMSTVNIKSLTVGQAVYGAFLTGKGTLIALGQLYRQAPDCFWYVVPPPLATTVINHLEQFHFAEQLTIEDLSSDLTVLGLWKKNAVDLNPQAQWADSQIKELTWLIVDKNSKVGGLKPLGLRCFEFYRIQAGVAQAGIELGNQDIILEGNVDFSVARSKGCYPGQEVVERIFTYGRVNRKLLPVQISGKALPPAPFRLFKEGAEVGELRSLAMRANGSGEALGLAMIRKAHGSESQPWTFKLPNWEHELHVQILAPERP